MRQSANQCVDRATRSLVSRQDEDNGHRDHDDDDEEEEEYDDDDYDHDYDDDDSFNATESNYHNLMQVREAKL